MAKLCSTLRVECSNSGEQLLVYNLLKATSMYKALKYVKTVLPFCHVFFLRNFLECISNNVCAKNFLKGESGMYSIFDTYCQVLRELDGLVFLFEPNRIIWLKCRN